MYKNEILINNSVLLDVLDINIIDILNVVINNDDLRYNKKLVIMILDVLKIIFDWKYCINCLSIWYIKLVDVFKIWSLDNCNELDNILIKLYFPIEKVSTNFSCNDVDDISYVDVILFKLIDWSLKKLEIFIDISWIIKLIIFEIILLFWYNKFL